MNSVTDTGTGLRARNKGNRSSMHSLLTSLKAAVWGWRSASHSGGAWQPFPGHVQRRTGYEVSLDLANTSPTETAHRGNLIRYLGTPVRLSRARSGWQVDVRSFIVALPMILSTFFSR